MVATAETFFGVLGVIGVLGVRVTLGVAADDFGVIGTPPGPRRPPFRYKLRNNELPPFFSSPTIISTFLYFVFSMSSFLLRDDNLIPLTFKILKVELLRAALVKRHKESILNLFEFK